MKFEIMFGQTYDQTDGQIEYGPTLLRRDRLSTCRNCGSMTRWHDILLNNMVCSEECHHTLWDVLKENESTRFENFEKHFEFVKQELKLAFKLEAGISRDIIIVVKDQLKYIQECLESVLTHTADYSIYIWDNGSQDETRQYLSSIESENVHLFRSEENVGFIEPNNDLVTKGTGDYIILLNSDCRVWENWDQAMIGYLRANPSVLQVGYWGGHLDQDGVGFGGCTGSKVDYIPGWCFCISRSTFEQYGLFNPELKFAYAEDADLSLRLQEAGAGIYALYSGLVYHHQNKTVEAVYDEGKIDLNETFEHNRRYLVERWKDYLRDRRVTLQEGEV